MNIPSLVMLTVMVVVFSSALTVLGLHLVQVDSMQKRLTSYRAHPDQASFVDKYVFGFVVMDGKLQEMTINSLGDKFWSLWIRISGGIFMFFALSFTVGLIAMWYLTLTGKLV